MQEGLSVVLLAYKEEENLRILLPLIIEQIGKINKSRDDAGLPQEQYELIVVDGMESLDNTQGVCSEHGAKYVNQETPYFGGAFRTAIKHASFDKFLIMDADFSHDPAAIPAIYEKFVTGYDVVIGSRYIEGGKNNDSTQSVIMSKTLNIVSSILLGIKAKDISTDYRMYHTRQLKAVKLKSNDYVVLQEVFVMLRLHKRDLRIGEVPITFSKRRYGKTKRRLFKQVMSFAVTLIRLTFVRIFCRKSKPGDFR